MFGGVLATPISLPVEVSMTVLTLIYVPGLLLFLRASRDARLQEVTLLDPHGLAAQRLVLARRALEVGSLRLAIIDAASAVDLVASVSPRSDGTERMQLEAIRRRATDPDETVAEDDALAAVDIAGRWVNPTTSP